MADDTDYGSDCSTYVNGDLDPTFTLLTGRRIVAEAVLRRWETPNGSLPWDTNAGLDVRAWVNEAIDDRDVYELRRLMEAEAEKDERVFSCTVTINPLLRENRLRIESVIETADGAFTLVADIGELTVELLRVE